MVTAGKRLSSCIAVGCVWVGGSVLAQFIYAAAQATLAQKAGGWPFSLIPVSDTGQRILPMLLMPLAVAFGGTLAVAAVRLTSGWPKISMPSLFLRAWLVASFSLYALPFMSMGFIALVAGLLGVAAAVSVTWAEAGAHDLGTHLAPGSTLTLPSGTEGRPAK